MKRSDEDETYAPGFLTTTNTSPCTFTQMKHVFLLCCLVCLLIEVGTVYAAEPINMSNNTGYLFSSSQALPNNSQVTINLYMPINVYVERGDGFHILQIGDGNLTAKILNSTDKNMTLESDLGNIIVHQGPLAEVMFTGNSSHPVHDGDDIASMINDSILSSP